ncbi:MAG: DUF1015 domain-containing protein, partial [Syntrophomonadaceae bacterium]|nr:DUF1015 domain-containing protein [Syntrophomonadaceae bacterium]
MTTIVPFRGLRYNQQKIADISKVVTPPYDIIDEAAQARYYADNPVNVIRLELGLIFPEDTPANNRYTRSAQYLQKWMEDQTLKSEEKPSLYLYQQDFEIKGEKLTRTGLLCGLQVEPYAQGNILPHEETLSKPKADRLSLMRTTHSNFSSIFGLYSDEKMTIEKALRSDIKDRAPDMSMVDEAGELHQIWVISDEKTVAKVVKAMADKKIYIADGHHRYETALAYSEEMHEQGKPGYNYVMATLVNLYDEGLVVLPTHRVVGNLKSFEFNAFMKKLDQTFSVQPIGSREDLSVLMEKMASLGTQHAFGMYFDHKLYLLTLKDFNQACTHLPTDKSAAWKALDVAIVDNLILDGLLSIGEQERRNQDNLAYSRDEEWVVNKIDGKEYQIGFFLNPTKVQEIVDVA